MALLNYVALLKYVSYEYKNQSWVRDNFLASRQRQRYNVIEPPGQEKIRKIFRSRCLDGVAK